MKSPIHWKFPPLIVLACLSVLVLTVCNFFGLLSPQFPSRPDFLPRASEVCEGRVARMGEPRLRGTRLWVDKLYCRDGEIIRDVPGMAQLTVMGSVDVPSYGDIVRFRSHLHTPHSYHNPGAIDWERKAASDGVAWSGSVESAEWIMVIREGTWSPLRAIDQWRQILFRQISKISDDNSRGSAAALLLGDAGLLPEKFGDGLRYLGIIHLYVISGLHVAIVAWAAYGLLYWLLVRRSRWALQHPLWRWAAAGSMVAVWIYVGLVGGGVSVVRAGVMVSVYLISKILDRHPHIGAAIALAALILIAQSPHVIFIPGFQLSFVAVIALLLFCPKLTGIRQWLWAALVATWATVPIVAYHFHQTPFLGIPANLIAGPYTTIILMPLGFLWTLVASIPHLAELFQTLWTYSALPLVRAIEWATPLAESTQWTFTPTIWEILWWYAPVVLMWVIPAHDEEKTLWGGAKGLSPSRAPVPRLAVRYGDPCERGGHPLVTGPHTVFDRGIIAGIIVWIAMGVLLVALRTCDAYRAHPLQLTFFDVGQGASVLVEFPNRHTMLIDAGGAPGSDFDVGRWVVAPALHARGITHIDDLVLTHPHPDHYGGLAYIAEHFSPRHFYTNGSAGEEGDAQWQAFSDRMQAAGQTGQRLYRGQEMQHGSTLISWRHPPETGPDESLGKNNGSLVADIQEGDFRALIVGDIHAEAEAELLHDPELGSVSVMQVPHHASRSSSTRAFLERVNPQVAVAQLGFENRYGFPHAEVTKRYSDFGIALCRTDRDGAVTITATPNANSPTRQFSIQMGRPSETCTEPGR